MGTVASTVLPDDVRVHRLTTYGDDRGSFTEVYRREWSSAPDHVQWNFVTSEPGVLRGVHVHPVHHDALTVVSGTLVLGLHDLRPQDQAERVSAVVTLTAGDPVLVEIPPGVCHGFYFPEAAAHVYGVSSTFDPADELGCAWDSPQLGLDWAPVNPRLSERDRAAASYDEMRARWIAATEAAR